MPCLQNQNMIDSTRYRTALNYTLIWFILLLTVSVLNIHHAQAETVSAQQTPSFRDATQGTLFLRTSQAGQRFPAPTLHTQVHLTVTGLIARSLVRQEFENPGNAWAEGIYVFPLPETAAVDHLRMYIGERLIEGQIHERTQAKKRYTDAKRNGKRASLIEQERPNMFTASVANIGPNERIIVEIEYQETVEFKQGQFSLRFPMVVGPRYIPGSIRPLHETISNIDGHGWAKDTHEVPDASRITPPVQHPAQGKLNPVTISIDLTPGFPLSHLSSTYHAIRHIETEEGHHQVTLQEEEIPADRDFELIWKPKSDHAPQAAIFTEHHDTDTYILLMLMPPTTTSEDQETLPRDVTFVIDTSGSMHGTSIQQAKVALQLALTRLKAQDRFNIIRFSNATHTLFSTSQPVTPQTIQQATWFVQNLTAEGGTEMQPALVQSLQSRETEKQLRQVIFITDGQIGNEESLFQSIREHLRQTRLFTVGIGSAPNSYFMRKAAQYGRGTFTYIGQTTEVQDKMNQLFQKLEHPVASHIQVMLADSHHMDHVPSPIPDLYLGEPLMIALRSDTLPNQITVKGQIGLTPWETSLALTDAAAREGVAVYWARQKIASLMDERIHGKDTNLIRDQVLALAMRHHLVSRYTSLVAVDVTPARSQEHILSSHALKTHLPFGQDHTAIFGLTAGATPGNWQLTVGLLLVVIAGACYQWVRIRT